MGPLFEQLLKMKKGEMMRIRKKMKKNKIIETFLLHKALFVILKSTPIREIR